MQSWTAGAGSSVQNKKYALNPGGSWNLVCTSNLKRSLHVLLFAPPATDPVAWTGHCFTWCGCTTGPQDTEPRIPFQLRVSSVIATIRSPLVRTMAMGRSHRQPTLFCTVPQRHTPLSCGLVCDAVSMPFAICFYQYYTLSKGTDIKELHC